jgi:hypothetical protein
VVEVEVGVEVEVEWSRVVLMWNECKSEMNESIIVSVRPQLMKVSICIVEEEMRGAAVTMSGDEVVYDAP